MSTNLRNIFPDIVCSAPNCTCAYDSRQQMWVADARNIVKRDNYMIGQCLIHQQNNAHAAIQQWSLLGKHMVKSMNPDTGLWPSVWKDPDEIHWLHCGENYHSRVARVHIGDEQSFLKVYGLPGREDQFTQFGTVDQLLRDVVAYRAELQQSGVRVPQGKDYHIEADRSGNYLLYILETYEGETSLGEVLDVSGWEGTEGWIDSIMQTLAPLLFSPGSNGHLNVGIDPKPTNFVVANGILSYVDLVWPLNATALESIHPEIRPTWDFRYFSRAGIMLNVLIQFARQNTALREVVINRICNAIADPELKNAFLALPGVSPIESGVGALRSGEIAPWNVDALRALGIQLAACSCSADGSFLSSIFDLSRTNPHEPLPMENIRTCREILLQA